MNEKIVAPNDMAMRRAKLRSAAAMASAILAFFLTQFLWMALFASLGWMPMADHEVSASFLALLLSGMALGLAVGYFVGNLVEGQSPRELAQRVFGPLRSVVAWALVAGGLTILLVLGYYIFQSIATLPVSVAIVLGALIIASAIRR
jgi:hypothetical protein